MNPDSFGKGFNGAPLLQVNFDHLLAAMQASPN